LQLWFQEWSTKQKWTNLAFSNFRSDWYRKWRCYNWRTWNWTETEESKAETEEAKTEEAKTEITTEPDYSPELNDNESLNKAMIDANDIEIYELTIDNGEIDIDEDVEDGHVKYEYVVKIDGQMDAKYGPIRGRFSLWPWKRKQRKIRHYGSHLLFTQYHITKGLKKIGDSGEDAFVTEKAITCERWWIPECWKIWLYMNEHPLWHI
jgi:hypothetical protein